MWITDLSREHATRIFGERAEEIRKYVTDLARGETSKPSSLSADEYEEARAAFGPNGPSVVLFLRSWAGIRWRSREGTPHPRDEDVTRVHHYTEALGPTTSPVWAAALTDSGYQGSDFTIDRVWTAAGQTGALAGGHHPSLLAGGAAGELAQMPRRDLHFFLDMMPWVRDGYWPCGWDDERHRLKVF